MTDQSNRSALAQSQFQHHWLDFTYSVRTSPYSSQIKGIVDAALAAVDPYRAVRRAIHLDGSHLIIAEQIYDLDNFQQVVLVGVGKAAYPMSVAMEDILGDRLATGFVVTKDGYAASTSGPEKPQLRRTYVFEAGHPIPDARGIAATQEIIHLLESLGNDDLVIFLISGGGSALLNFPVPGVSLVDLQNLTYLLLRFGATVNQLNTLRKHLDLVKGGGLARLAAPAVMATLVLSDVVGDPLDVIASGPTVPDDSTFQDAWSILEQFSLIDEIPGSIRYHLDKGRRGEIPETLKPGDPIFDRTQQIVIASNYQAASAAVGQARASGMNALLLTSFLQGEARDVGRMMAALARQIQATGEPVKRPACIIAGGETTVTIRGDGMGGRNQEVALGSIEEMAGLSRVLLVALATDGGDGPTDAAGAVVAGDSRERALKLSLEPRKFLERNDAYNFFDNMGDLLWSGPTRTNVNDLTFLFVF
jgi:hydroxypyruvate reductase